MQSACHGKRINREDLSYPSGRKCIYNLRSLQIKNSIDFYSNLFKNYQVLLLNRKPIPETVLGTISCSDRVKFQGNTKRESYENETRMLVGKSESNPKASWQSGCGL